MATQAQVNANRENAKHSTGPTSSSGAQASSKNALKHGLTSQTIYLTTPEEAAAYSAHVQKYMDEHKPSSYRHRVLVQDLADTHWSSHQVFLQQAANMSLMNAITMQMAASGADAIATAAALVPVSRTLATLSTYEGRKRRAAKAIQNELIQLAKDLAQEAAALLKPNKTKPEPEIGFVCPTPAEPVSPAEFARQCEEFEAAVTLLQQQNGHVTDEEVMELLNKYR